MLSICLSMADDDLFPVWCYVDRLEQLGKITEFEAIVAEVKKRIGAYCTH